MSLRAVLARSPGTTSRRRWRSPRTATARSCCCSSDQYNERQPDGTLFEQSLRGLRPSTAPTTSTHRTSAHYEALIPEYEKVAPQFGEAFVYQSLNCAFWPVRATKDPGVISADGAPPILVVGTTGDPATPYQWAVNLAKQLSSGVLLTREGEGHTAYGDSACIHSGRHLPHRPDGAARRQDLRP